MPCERRRPVTALACLALALVVGCGNEPTIEADPSVVDANDELREVVSPAGPNSAEPRLGIGGDNRLYLSWIEALGESQHALHFARWEGEQWSEPRTIATGTDWFVNWADFPSITALADGTLAAHWLRKSAESTYAYDVVLSTSSDSGSRWSEPVSPHDDGTPTEHGFVSVVPGLDGSFDVIWLDGRQAADEPPGPMTLRHARLSVEGHVTMATLIDGRVCDCCPTEARRMPDGGMVVAYRGRTEEEVRDIRVARYDGEKWSEPLTVHDDGWVVPGCPVNGPALDAKRGVLAAAWYTEPSKDHGSVRVAFSADGGETFEAPISLDEGRPIGRVDLALLDDGSALVSWIEQNEDGAAILVHHVERSGGLESPVIATTTSVSRSSGFPQMVHLDGKTHLAWTDTSGGIKRVRTATLVRRFP